MIFCRLQVFKITFSTKSFNTDISVSDSLDSDQAGHFIWPDLGPKCLQSLSKDNISRYRVNQSLNR